MTLRHLIALVIIIVAAVAIGALASCGSEITDIQPEQPERSAEDIGIRALNPTSTYVPNVTTTPEPISSNVGYPLTYGLALNNTYTTLTTADFDILARFDIAELQSEAMFAKWFDNAHANPVTDGTKTAGQYIKDESEVNTKVGLRTQFRTSNDVGWEYVASAWSYPANTPTATPTSVSTATPTCNDSDYYCRRRAQAFLAAGGAGNAGTGNDPPVCTTWQSCDKDDNAVYTSFKHSQYNTYNGEAPDPTPQLIGTDSYAQWATNWWAAQWDSASADFIRDDTANVHWWSYVQVYRDSDRDGTNDQVQFGGASTEAGRRDADLLQLYGAMDMMNMIREEGIPFWGNGTWEMTEIDGTTATQEYHATGSIDGIMIELTDDVTHGPKGYFKAWDNTHESCTTDCLMKVMYDWQQESRGTVLLGTDSMTASSKFSSAEEVFLYYFAMNGMLDGYLSWGTSSGSGYGDPNWKDEYWVTYNGVSGKCESTTSDSDGHHWLGLADTNALRSDDGTTTLASMLGAATWDDTDDYAWFREFDFGLMAFNPTSSTKALPAGAFDSDTFREVDGTSDITSYTLDPYEGIVLCNITEMAAGAPTAPSSLTATTIDEQEIDLAWSDDSDDEIGFKIYRDGGSGYTNIYTTTVDIEAYEDVGLAASTTYTYYVKSYNVYGDSSASNTDSDTTDSGTPATPAAPTSLDLAVEGMNEIEVSWTDNSDNETGFKIWRDSGAGYSQVYTTTVNIDGWSNTGLSASTTYTYYVKAYNEAGLSASSNVESDTTLSPTPVPTPVITTMGLNEIHGGNEDANNNGVVEPNFDQCIEVINASGGTQDMTGWTLKNNGDTLYTYTESVSDGGRYVLFGNDWDGTRLQPGDVTLYDGTPTAIDTVTLTQRELQGGTVPRSPDEREWLHESVTNECTNPSIETNTTGWSDGNGNVLYARSSDENYIDDYALKSYISLPGYTLRQLFYNWSFASAPSESNIGSVYVKSTGSSLPASSYLSYRVYWVGGANGSAFDPNYTTIETDETLYDNQWFRAEFTIPDADYSDRTNAYIYLFLFDCDNDDQVMWIDGFQIEQERSVSSAYCDGDQPHCEWTGTDHASTSTRTGAQWPTCGFSNAEPTPDGWTPQPTLTPWNTPTSTPTATPTATLTPTWTATPLVVGTATHTPTSTPIP